MAELPDLGNFIMGIVKKYSDPHEDKKVVEGCLEWNASLKEINGVNLANYFPHQRSINSVVFIHKKYLNDHQYPEVKKERVKSKKEKKKQDKGQQFNSEKNTEISENNRTYKISNNSDHVMEQTIRFAKNLVPLVIPQSDEKLPVFYTVKSSKRHRRKEKKPQETSFDHHATHDEKRDPKKVFDNYRKIRKENFSIRESLSHASSNTIDDLNNNQSISCTYSEVSEKKYHRKEKSHNKKHNDPKLVVSESFDALTTEYPGDSKIKIHLMSEKDKQSFTESIKTPIMTALKECIAEISNCNLMTDINSVQKILKCNTSKLDTILERISCIEHKLDSHALEKKSENRASENKVAPKLVMPEVKSSVLEQLEEDVIESKDDFSSEEELHQELLYRRSKSTTVTELVVDDKSGKNLPSGAGEVTGGLKELSTAGVKPDRPNRIPARFCWTDAARK